jgi:hypothetical protein
MPSLCEGSDESAHSRMIYFGSFLAIGWIIKVAADRLTRDADLSDIQSQAGTNLRRNKAFL